MTMERMLQPKRMPTKAKYEQILAALTLLCNSESLANLKRAGYKQIHYWHKSYAVVVSGGNNESQILVLWPKTHIGVFDIPLDSVQQIEYIEKVFHDLLVTHGDDHSKEHTLHGWIGKKYANISRPVCEAFLVTCPGCIIIEQQCLC